MRCSVQSLGAAPDTGSLPAAQAATDLFGDRRVRVDLNALIRLVQARRGHFLLASGDHGDLWLDLDRVFLKPRRVARFASHLAGALSPFRVDAVCGPFAGGAFLAQLIASELDSAFCYTEYAQRREIPDHTSETGRQVATARYRLPAGLRDAVAGKRVAVADDAINAGFATRGTLAELRSYGAEPVGVGALLVLGPSGERPTRFDGLPLTAIANLPSAVWPADACPLCAQGVPVEAAGSVRR